MHQKRNRLIYDTRLMQLGFSRNHSETGMKIACNMFSSLVIMTSIILIINQEWNMCVFVWSCFNSVLPDIVSLYHNGAYLKHDLKCFVSPVVFFTSQSRHNECDSVLNYQRLDYLLKWFFRHRSKKHQSSASLAFARVIPLLPVDSPSQRASSTENVSILWRLNKCLTDAVICSCLL